MGYQCKLLDSCKVKPGFSRFAAFFDQNPAMKQGGYRHGGCVSVGSCKQVTQELYDSSYAKRDPAGLQQLKQNQI